MVRKLPSGRWQASYHHPHLSKRVPGPNTWMTKADATAWLSSEETKLRSGVSPIDIGRGKVSFVAYAEEWLENRPLRDRTREVYASQLKVHILPEFGATRLSGITPERVRKWNSRLAKTAPAMAPKAYRQLRTMLETAVEDGIIAQNPCRVRGGAQENSIERSIPTIEQVHKLASSIEPRFRMLVLVAAFCGLRKSECFGLARRHVVQTGSNTRLVVERQRNEVAGKGVVFAELKTDAAYRKVVIPQSLVDDLAEHLERYVGPGPDDLLFTMERTCDMPRASSWTRLWNQARSGAELPTMRFHDLRHLAGTLSAIAGGTLKEIQDRLGHASPDAAMVYQHVAQGRDEELASQIDRIIGR